MRKTNLYLLTCAVSLVFVAGVIGIILLITRRRLRQSKEYRTLLTALRKDNPVMKPADHTKFEIPSLHSTGNIVNIEIQPSVSNLSPQETKSKSLTEQEKTPQIKFSLHYDTKS